ncbi:MAG: hypothetical protein AB7E30_05345 [Lawsonibacter sp.]
MKLAQYLDFYDTQANAAAYMDGVLQRMTGSIQTMTDALDRTVERMNALLTSIQKTGSASADIETPFDNVANNMAKAVSTTADLTQVLSPQNFMIGLAISVGWQLFGDDIMTILTPAMGVLESFAGMVHSLLGALAPVFAPVVWVIGLVAQMLDVMAANMNALLPIVLGMAVAIAFWNAKMIASTAAGWAETAMMWAKTTGTNALKAATGLLSAAQGVLNNVMKASPMMWVLGIVVLLMGRFAMLIEQTGSLKNAWASVMNKFRDVYNFIASGLNKLFGANIELKTHVALDPVPEAEKTKTAVQAKQESAYSLAQPVTMPDTSALTAQLPDYDALSTGNSVYTGGGSGAAWSGEPLAVDTVGILESVTGPVTMSDETMGMLKTMMAENRSDVTVTPTVVVNATVREESDIRKLVSGIERVVEEEFRASAEGVYSGTGGRTVSC